MKLKKWSLSAVMMATLVAGGQENLFADDYAPRSKWRLPFGRSNTSCAAPTATPACEAPATSAAPAAASAPAPTQPAVAAAAFQAPAPPAMFAAPPPAGEITGETNSLGLRGFAITMPEMRFELPTLHLPSTVRSRRNAEMRVDSSRAPLVSGAPTAYGPLANAGFVSSANAGFASTQAAPTASPAGPAPAAAPAKAAPAEGCIPAPAESCVPFYYPPPSPAPAAQEHGAFRRQSVNEELLEARRALVLYRQELERLERSLDSATSSDSAEAIRSPASNVRGASSSQFRPLSSTTGRRTSPPKILEAGYVEEKFEDSEEVVATPQSRVASPRATRPLVAPSPSAPKKRSTPALREVEPPLPQNVGMSYISDVQETTDDGLGVWKGEGQRPVPKRGDGSAKRSSH